MSSNLPTVDEKQPFFATGPGFAPSSNAKAPTQDDDDCSFASEATTQRVVSAKSANERKLAKLFGSEYRIQNNRLEGYTEFGSIVEAPPEKFYEPVVGDTLKALIAGTSCFGTIHRTILNDPHCFTNITCRSPHPFVSILFYSLS